MSKLSIGMMVCLASDTSIEGAVIGIHESSTETAYDVYTGAKGIQTYYESQLIPKIADSTSYSIKKDEFHAAITAAFIRNPSLLSLYSINSARIDFIPHQFRPVLKLVRADRPRLLIADGVGVGKTIEAGLILREMQARRNIESVLIICPRPLITEQKWESEMKRFDQEFEPLNGEDLRKCLRETELNGNWPEKYSKAIIPFSLFDERNVLGKTASDISLLQMENPPKFDLVIVDEAHHIRNRKTFAYAAVKQFCDNAEAVIFLTATPVQLEYDDLFVMMNLLRPDLIIDKDTFRYMAEPNTYINKAVSTIRNKAENWETDALNALEQALYKTNWGKLVLQKNPAAYNIIVKLMSGEISDDDRIKLISDVENLHTFSNLISRTRRRDIGEFTVRKATTVTVDFTPKQRELHDAILNIIHEILSTIHCNQSTKFMMTTIRRQTASCIFGLVPFLRDILSRHLDELIGIQSTEDSDFDEMNESKSLYDDVVEEINRIIALAEHLPEYDPKLDSLIRILTEKQEEKNNRVMIFSTFKHTLKYLHEKLSIKGFRVGLIQGDTPDEDRRKLRHRFKLDRSDSDAIDVLLFSEVGCEGLDYQFCDCMVNYDLPWNPMRIEQRIGRIDRNGQTSESVSIYNMVTPGTVDYDIYDRCTNRIGVFKQSIGDCEEILGSLSSDILRIVESTTLTAEDVKMKLQQLADNKIRLVQEQIQLEDRQKDLFGIRIPQNSFNQEVEDATNYWLSSSALQNMINIYLKEIIGIDKEFITGDKAIKSLRLSQEAKNTLLTDFKSCCFPSSLENKMWEKELKTSNTRYSITFNPDSSDTASDILLITLAHPLAKQAALHFKNPQKNIALLKVVSDLVKPGEYPFIMYQWMYAGDRENLVIKPVCSTQSVNKYLLELLQKSDDYGSYYSYSDDLWDGIEDIQHRMWEIELQQHKQYTHDLITYKLGTLTTSHQSRISFITEQIRKASNPKIRIMRDAELRNATNDFEIRKSKLQETYEKADIVVSKLSYGILFVEAP